MSMNDMVSAERVHIGFFGVRNAGKSSVVNAVTGQEMALVSDVKGTTTDPVKKAMELLPLGPVVIIDTPGIDDEGELGELRVKRARKVLNYTDVAVLVLDAQKGMSEADRGLVALFEDKKIPYALVYNKADLVDENKPGEGVRKLEANVPNGEAESTGRDLSGANSQTAQGKTEQASGEAIRKTIGMPVNWIHGYDESSRKSDNIIYVSAKTGQNIYELKELLARLVKQEENRKRIVADLLSPNDVVVLVVPIDSAAPKGRLILPQQQTIRDILEAGAAAVVTRESELKETLASLQKKPRLVITDSQAFGQVSKDTPQDILLTSFSILFVRYKGDLNAAIRGAAQLDRLKDGDTVLIAEGCTHHRQCDDIGTVKLPRWIREYAAKCRAECVLSNFVEGVSTRVQDQAQQEKGSVDIRFEFTSGMGFPEDLSKYALIVHCGGCMLNEREMQYRVRQAVDAGVPITNYGVAIAQMHGILRRSLGPFPDTQKLLDN